MWGEGRDKSSTQRVGDWSIGTSNSLRWVSVGPQRRSRLGTLAAGGWPDRARCWVRESESESLVFETISPLRAKFKFVSAAQEVVLFHFQPHTTTSFRILSKVFVYSRGVFR